MPDLLEGLNIPSNEPAPERIERGFSAEIAPKLMVVEFYKATVGSTALDEKEFQFEIIGSMNYGLNYVHRMRQALSRIRTSIIKAGQIPDPFSMIRKSIEVKGSVCVIILTRNTSTLSEEAQDAINTLSLNIKGE